MADFLDKLTEAVESNLDALQGRLQLTAGPEEAELESLVRRHWQPLPPTRSGGEWPAYAVDGSVRQVNLDNGGYLFIAQALALGSPGLDEARVDVQVLPSGTQPDVASDFKDLCQAHRELSLACEVVGAAEAGSVLFLDGALYGRLPQMYPRLGCELAEQYRVALLTDYLQLLATAQRRGVRLVAVSKTSREAAHAKLWLAATGADLPAALDDLSDSEMIHRWTDNAAGQSVPVLLGTRGFTGGSKDLLDQPEIAGSPAIVSFFARLADYDDALRVDVPAYQVGADTALGALEGQVLPGGCAAVAETVDYLRADYGGLEVYNALLYSVDREVRLRRDMVMEVYLPVIEELTGVTVRRNRSERRF